MVKEICVDARMLPSGGIGTYLKNLLIHLKDAEVKWRLLIPSGLEKEKWLHDFDCTVINAPIYSLREQWLLPRKILPCDLFWSPHYNVPLFSIRAKKRLVTIHDVYHLAFLSSLKVIEKIYAKKVLKKAAQLSDAIITVSQFSANEMQKFIKAPKEKIKVIPCGVDQVLFTPNRETEKIKKRYQLPDHFFIYVGNHKPHKNLKRLMAAYRSLLTQGEEKFLLVMVGRHRQLSEEIQKDPLLAGNVRFLGHVPDDDLPTLYQLARALVFPSLYEGFGLPPLEAMSVGCPVIASNRASLPEVCGQAAHYIDPYDEQAIAHAMKTLLSDYDKRLGLIEAGFKQAKVFSWEKSAKDTLSVMQALCQ